MIVNREKDSNRVIIFLHIPKSAGSTFINIISKQKQYGEDACIWQTVNVEALAIEEQKRIELIYGHMPFGVHKKLPQKDFTYITFLRHPVERLISFYYYLCSEKYGDAEVREWFRKIPLIDYVSDEKFNRAEDLFPGSWTCATVNSQTRILAGTMEEDLETAKNNLKNYFSVVGTADRFTEALLVVEKKFGWNVNDYENVNVTPDKPALKEIPDEIIKIIESKNEKDIALYQFANQLLDEQLQSIKT